MYMSENTITLPSIGQTVTDLSKNPPHTYNPQVTECINVMRTQNKMKIDRLRICMTLLSNECKNMRVKDWILHIRQ